MKKNYFYTGMFAALLALPFVGCDDDIDPLVEELTLDRVLSPMGLEAAIRDLTTIQLDWSTRDEVDHYIVEFSEDSLEFTNIIRTVTVQPEDIPIRETFFGDTRYSARVKGVSAGETGDSKWTAITIRTEPENIFEPLENEDVASVEATLRWPGESVVTRMTINPGNINRTITAEEIEAGEAIITDLSERTAYTITLYAGNSQRGQVQFKTLVDPEGPNAVEVHAEDDLSGVIANAAAGATLVLYPGDYTAFTGSIVVNKDIKIIGYLPYNKPQLHVQFSLEGGLTNLEVADVDLDGDATLTDAFRFNTVDAQYGALVIDGCNVHDFARSFVAGSVLAKVTSVTVNNCVVTDVLTSGGDFIDFRTTYVGDVKVTNSTFDNCAPGRDFVRIDNAGHTGTGLNSNVLIDHCTLYGVSNTQDRILYVRFATNTLTLKNTLIAATDGYLTNQPSSAQPTCANNNYFNAAGFYTPAYVTNAKIDESGTHTTLDPGFADAVNGNFTVSNQTLIDNQIGDPRWLQ